MNSLDTLGIQKHTLIFHSIGLTFSHPFLSGHRIILEVFIVSFGFTLGKQALWPENQFGLVLFYYN